MNFSLLISLEYFVVDVDMNFFVLFYTEDKAIIVMQAVLCEVLVTILAISHLIRSNVGPSTNNPVGSR